MNGGPLKGGQPASKGGRMLPPAPPPPERNPAGIECCIACMRALRSAKMVVYKCLLLRTGDSYDFDTPEIHVKKVKQHVSCGWTCQSKSVSATVISRFCKAIEAFPMLLAVFKAYLTGIRAV